MASLRQDPLVNVVHEGIKRDIRVALDHQCWRAAIILTFSGIDMMAYLGMPANRMEAGKAGFADWCNRYMQFEGPHQVTGLDLYGARCGIVHSYGAVSKLSREGKCRNVVYRFQRRGPPIVFRPEVDPTLVIVSVEALAIAFFSGVDRFLVDLFSNKSRAVLAESRFKGMYHLVPAADFSSSKTK